MYKTRNLLKIDVLAGTPAIMAKPFIDWLAITIIHYCSYFPGCQNVEKVTAFMQ